LWQLITAICDAGDGLTLCEQLSEGYGFAHCFRDFSAMS
jgi:hypothetical protein